MAPKQVAAKEGAMKVIADYIGLFMRFQGNALKLGCRRLVELNHRNYDRVIAILRSFFG